MIKIQFQTISAIKNAHFNQVVVFYCQEMEDHKTINARDVIVKNNINSGGTSLSGAPQ
jgi:hypothetical protein